ncbi:hypothetical protein BDZ97DRAFT_1794169 [Flammula alnicola]|nr:hypothetical protein BDZ97DRAFT_1794169 [Flammula alnicola]
MAARAAVNGAKPPKVLPPSSPFGELLRRSHFASYDPQIRQTYSAPPSYIHRGNWGLKRPIANRNRHSHIVLRNFEEHAQFIEWDKAAGQVDFVKRIEELNHQPILTANTPWALSLGPSAATIDSDFCPAEDVRAKEAETLAKNLEEEAPVDTQTPISSPKDAAPESRQAAFMPPSFSLFNFGNEGRGTYGARGFQAAGPKSGAEAYIQPNIAAMTPLQFADYLEELRDLRPEFLKYMKQELEKLRKEEGKYQTDEGLVMTLGAKAVAKGLHRFFLGKHTQAQFDAQEDDAVADLEPESEPEIEKAQAAAKAAAAAAANTPQPIQGQPHKFAGLMYSMPTLLETFYSVRPEPGLILQDGSPGGNSNFHAANGNDFVAAFGGMTAKLNKKDAGPSPVPLLEPYSHEGLNAPSVPDGSGGASVNTAISERNMRMTELKLETPPKVVGNSAPNKSLNWVQVRSKVIVDGAVDQNWRINPYTPGSMKYNAVLEPNRRTSIHQLSSWTAQPFSRRSTQKAAHTTFEKRVAPAAPEPHAQEMMIDQLRGMVATGGKKPAKREEK